MTAEQLAQIKRHNDSVAYAATSGGVSVETLVAFRETKDAAGLDAAGNLVRTETPKPKPVTAKQAGAGLTFRLVA